MSNHKLKFGKYSQRLLLFSLLLFIALSSNATNADVDSELVLIENVTAYALDSSVIIYWDTNIMSDSLITYGTTSENLTEEYYFKIHSLAHSAELRGLLPETLYYFRVNSSNSNGNSNVSELYNFTTQLDNVSPIIGEIIIKSAERILFNSTSNISTQAIYDADKTYIVQTHITDNGIVNVVFLNASFANEQIEMQNVPGTDIYESNISNLSAGFYELSFTATDLSNNSANSQYYNFKIDKAPAILNTSFYLSNGTQIQINEGSNNIQIEQRTNVNVSVNSKYNGPESNDAESNDAILSIAILNDSGILANISGKGILSTNFNFESPENYRVIFTQHENQNYSFEEKNFTINVSPIELNLFIDKPEYNLGEQVSYVALAPNNSNLTVEVCGPLPINPGFVECRTLIANQQTTYPFMNSHIITNKPGVYKIRAVMTHKGLTKSAEKNYSVINNMQVAITGKTLLKTGEQSSLTAVATGGVGIISFNWTLSNGTKISGPSLSVKYNAPNTYPIIITAVDEQGNSKSNTATLTVKKHYTIKVITLDNQDNAELDSARIKMTSSDMDIVESDDTDIDGIAQLDLIEGEYDMKITLIGYETHRSTILSDSNKTLTIKLVRATEQSTSENLEINLISPLNNTFMSTSKVEFNAYVDLGGNSKANCMFYVSESNSDWYRAMKTLSVTASGTLSHSDVFTDGAMHTWKVQCEANSKTYSSGTLYFKSASNSNSQSDETLLDSGYNKVIDAGEIRRQIDSAMSNFEAMDMESKKDAMALRFSENVEKALRDYERAMRDINNIQYRRDLSAQEQEAKKREYYDLIKSLQSTTMMNVKNIGTETFISYPSKDDLLSISNIYREAENIALRVNENMLSDKQNGIIVTTRISNIELTFVNGDKKIISLIDKHIKITDNTTNSFLLEYIPKEFAKSTDDLVVFNDFKTILKDPLLKFQKQDNITYYVLGERNLDLGKETNTVLMADSFFIGRNSITGDVTLSDVDFTSPTSLIIMIVLISCSYLIYAFDIFGSLFAKSRKRANEKTINRILGLVRDARIFIQQGRITNADLTFKEIKLIYEGSNEEVMTEVYSEVINLLELIDSAQTEILIRSADKGDLRLLSEEEKTNMQNSRKILLEAYKLLSENLRQRFGNKIDALVSDMEKEQNKIST
jgi:hypothetical protein